MNAEDKNPDEDNDDGEENINFVMEDVDEVENKEPGETKLIKSKIKSKASVIDDDGTWWKWKYQYKNEEKKSSRWQNTWKRSGAARYETIIMK